MERANQSSLVPALFLALAGLTHSHDSAAAGYSYYVDYFKVESATQGVHQDDFNDGNLYPWYIEAGTAQETGGTAILKDPGEPGTMGSASQERTALETTGSSPLNITVWPGNTTATTHWVTNVQPLLGQAYMMGAGMDFDNDGEIYIYTGLVNADQVTADALHAVTGASIPTGLFAFFEVGVYIPNAPHNSIFQVAPITDTSLFDDASLFLRLGYEELTDELSASIIFGDDENGAAWEPFDKVAMPDYQGDLEFSGWDLEAASFSAVPIPAALPLFGSALGLFGLMGRRRRGSQDVS